MLREHTRNATSSTKPMRRSKSCVVLFAAWLSIAVISPVSAQESPTSEYPDAQTTVAEWIAGGHPLLQFGSASVCPDERPWNRAVVNGMAAIEPTSQQAYFIARGWRRMLRCNDPVVNRWYSRALGYATTRSTGQSIAEALVISKHPEHLAALRAAIVSDAVSDVVRRGILYGVNEQGELSLRADILLFAVREDRVSSIDYFNREMNQLMRSAIKEEFMATAAEEVRTHPRASHASHLFSYLAYSAAERTGSPYAVSDNARRNLLRVMEQIKPHPAVAAAMARTDVGPRFGMGYERQIRERLEGR